MLILSSKKSYRILYLYILEKLSYVADIFCDNVFYTLYFFNCSTHFFIKLFSFSEKLKTYLRVCFYGARKIVPEENCPSVRVRVWLSISVRISAGGAIFLEGNFPRTVFI